MKNFLIAILFSSISSFAQSTDLIFQGFEKISDTLSTIQIPIGNGYYRNVVRDTVSISVPANEVWIMDQSYLSFKTNSPSNGSLDLMHDYSRNSIYLDELILHNLFQSDENYLTYSSGIYRIRDSYNKDLKSVMYSFDKRIKILGGTHKIIRDIGVGSSFQMIHSIIFEKYSLN